MMKSAEDRLSGELAEPLEDMKEQAQECDHCASAYLISLFTQLGWSFR